MRSVAALSLGLALLACPAQADKARAIYKLDIWFEKGGCRVSVDGEYVPAKKLAKRLKLLPDKSAEIRISATEETPYRCTGGAIYEAQMAGFTRIGFVTKGAAP